MRTAPTDLHERAPRDLEAARAARSATAELSMVPRTPSRSRTITAKRVVQLVDGLEDDDDVQNVYANFDISESRARSGSVLT